MYQRVEYDRQEKGASSVPFKRFQLNDDGSSSIELLFTGHPLQQLNIPAGKLAEFYKFIGHVREVEKNGGTLQPEVLKGSGS